MKYDSAALIVAIIGLASAAPTPVAKNTFTSFSIPRAMRRNLQISAREVPQEQSHNKFLAGVRTSLNLDNPAGIQDPVFGLLGNAAAAAGAGTITNLDCLHQATADQAFTNAKAAGDVTGMSDALLYAALERNTGKVGLKSVLCTDKAVNPEIQAIQQHQDPASDGAAATNKAIVLELAQQLQAIGGNAQDALLSGTFAPGDLADNTGKGNTCDVADDAEGCIFTQNLLVDDATAAEITAAISGTAAAVPAAAVGAGAAASNATADACAVAASVAAAPAATEAASSAAAAAPAAATKAAAAAGGASAASGTNVQTFTGTLGGTPPPVISSAGGRPFAVNGATFVNAGAALQRSCAVQNNACSNAVNSGGAGSVSDCNAQEKACNAAASAKKMRRALDFGTCDAPTVEFAVGLDGRKEASFQAVSQTSFNHGSALNIAVISSFICGQLGSSCKAGADAVAACAKGQSAAGKSYSFYNS
jgi:hypothetical protein